MKEILRNCHGHNLSKGGIIKIFYHGLNETTQEALNVAVDGIFLYKSPNQAYELLEDKVLLKLDWAKNQKSNPLKRTIAFADGGPSNTNTDKIIARTDAMTMKMDAQYKELKSNPKPSAPNQDDDNIPIQFNDFMKAQQATNAFVKETFMGLKAQLEVVAKNHQASIQNLESKFNRLLDKQSSRPSGSFPSNTQPNPRVNQPDEAPINFESNDEEDEPTPQLKSQTPKPVKETSMPKPYKLKIPYPQRLRKEKMEAQYEKFLDMILPPKLGDPGSFLIPCNFNNAFSCNALADLGANINLMPYSLYAKLSLEALKPTKMSVRLVDRSFQYPIGIAKNMLIEVGKFTFLADFVILEMEEDSKIPLILGRPFLQTTDAIIRVKQKQLTIRVGTKRMIFNIDSAIKHSYSNDDTCFSIDVIDEILEEDFDDILDKGSVTLHSIKGTPLEEKIFAEFDEFMAMTANKNNDSESDEEEPKFEKITINTDYKIKTSCRILEIIKQ
ncbi:reverse transcriptase domain-containing protein [Tanacetum coccineum]